LEKIDLAMNIEPPQNQAKEETTKALIDVGV
jgi:hypothetical protein